MKTIPRVMVLLVMAGVLNACTSPGLPKNPPVESSGASTKTEAPPASDQSLPVGSKPEVVVDVDLTTAGKVQEQVDAGHTPGRMDPWQVASEFLRYEKAARQPNQTLKVVENTGTSAVVSVDKGEIERIYLERLVRKDKWGIWSVVGYDLRDQRGESATATSSGPAPDSPLTLKVPPASAIPGAALTVTLRVLEPERIAGRGSGGDFQGWLCFRDCAGNGASTSVTFTPSPGDPQLFTAEFTVPVLLRRSTGPSAEGKGGATAEFEPVVAGEYAVHAACILDDTGGCANRSEVSTTIRLDRGLDTLAWVQLPAGATAPVPGLGTMSSTARSPVPGSQRSIECQSGNFDPRMSEEPPRLLLTDDAGSAMPPIIFRAGGPLFGRHGYAGCGAVALDPVHTDTYYVTEAPHAGGAEPGAYPWPQFTQDRGETWAPVPAPEGFEARKTFVGFTMAADGVIAWFSRASLEGGTIAGGQIRGSLTRDGGRTWTTIAPSCPADSAACLWQLRDRPPLLRSGLIRSVDGGKTWAWATLSGIPFAADGVYMVAGSGRQVLEAVSGSPAQYWGFMPLLRSEDGGATWRYVQVPVPPGGWQGAPGFAPQIRLDAGGALLLGKTDGKGTTQWYRLDRGNTEWVPTAP